jgi:dienelactone hydrolase
MSEAVLDVVTPDGGTRAIALVLHGGRARSTQQVSPRHLAVLRMAPFARSLRAAGARHGLAVARLRFAVRGWNGDQQAPVADLRMALDRLAADHPGSPIALVGHSMGGRSAIYTAEHPAVQTVVALAPWIEAGDPWARLTGRDVLVIHGGYDWMTSPRASAALVTALQGVAHVATYAGIRGDSHAMLRRAGLWHELTTGYVLGSLCGVDPGETVGPTAAQIVQQALAGSPRVDV